jgi:hypothetical protein
MEWDNPARFHLEWDTEWRYLPQHACDHHGNKIALVWNASIPFQQFQRYAHGETEPDEYLNYIVSHLSDRKRLFPLYGNDVEIFNFRPGRYHTETPVKERSEWERIEDLFNLLKNDERFKIIPPSKLLEMQRLPGAGNDLRLESPEHPIPVKKQGKYNITRWAVTGRDDLGINTVCRRISDYLTKFRHTTEDDWKELCYLWSSDFRTHITEKRWESYIMRLTSFARKCESNTPLTSQPDLIKTSPQQKPVIDRKGRYVVLQTDRVRLSLNCDRGLSIKELCFLDKGGVAQIATLPHGYFDDISMGADWYSGHLVHEGPGQPKVTDLTPVSPAIEQGDDFVIARATVKTPFGPVHKSLKISLQDPVVTCQYTLEWETLPKGSLRLGYMTLNPEAFDMSSLFYRTCNGGRQPETFSLQGHTIQHGIPVSFLVSAESGLGMTDGWLELGDAKTCLQIELGKASPAVIGLVAYQDAGSKYFYRICFSAGEMDETIHKDASIMELFDFEFRLKLMS